MLELTGWELRRASRRWRTWVDRAVLAGLALLVAGLAWDPDFQRSALDMSTGGRALTWAVHGTCILMLAFGPSLAAGVIGALRRRDAAPLLLAAPVGTTALVLERSLAAVLRGLFLVLCVVPLLTVLISAGGGALEDVLAGVVRMGLAAVVAVVFGVLLSSFGGEGDSRGSGAVLLLILWAGDAVLDAAEGSPWTALVPLQELALGRGAWITHPFAVVAGVAACSTVMLGLSAVQLALIRRRLERTKPVPKPVKQAAVPLCAQLLPYEHARHGAPAAARGLGLLSTVLWREVHQSRSARRRLGEAALWAFVMTVILAGGVWEALGRGSELSVTAMVLLVVGPLALGTVSTEVVRAVAGDRAGLEHLLLTDVSIREALLAKVLHSAMTPTAAVLGAVGFGLSWVSALRGDPVGMFTAAGWALWWVVLRMAARTERPLPPPRLWPLTVMAFVALVFVSGTCTTGWMPDAAGGRPGAGVRLRLAAVTASGLGMVFMAVSAVAVGLIVSSRRGAADNIPRAQSQAMSWLLLWHLDFVIGLCCGFMPVSPSVSAVVIAGFVSGEFQFFEGLMLAWRGAGGLVVLGVVSVLAWRAAVRTVDPAAHKPAWLRRLERRGRRTDGPAPPSRTEVEARGGGPDSDGR